MKPFLSVTLVLILALAVMASCLHMTSSSSASPASVTQTYTAPMMTAASGPAPTADPLSSDLYSAFNMTIEGMVTEERINELEHIAGPSYQVIGVDFLQADNSLPVLRVKTRCECAENSPCCNSTRTFVVTIMVLGKIYHNPSFQTAEASGKMGVLEVWCYDHATLTGVVSVPGTDVISFLDGQINGFQLWAKVTPQP